MGSIRIYTIIAAVIFMTPFLAVADSELGGLGASIMANKHNLAASGPGQVKSLSESDICVFCHTPHNARKDIKFSWNREQSPANYIPYTSSTLYASPGQPTGTSKLCLSCHDGTIALGALHSKRQNVQFAGTSIMPPSSKGRLGTDLRDDHPISFDYSESLSMGNDELVPSSSLPLQVKLDEHNELQCTSCHDAHDDTFGKFLVMSNMYSALCTSCHDKKGWSMSSHSTSAATWNGRHPDPWPTAEYDTVSQNGCANCHQQHSGGGNQRLLINNIEENNCLQCHNGNVSQFDVEQDLNKPYSHPVDMMSGIHDPTEKYDGSVQNHVECEDCHNPHFANSSENSPPEVSGRNAGVSGITSSGAFVENASFQYEICYKCHGDMNNNVIGQPDIQRQFTLVNTRQEFALTNASFHPVEGRKFQNTSDVPSLLSPYREDLSLTVYCTDCHGSESGTRGPHGSNNMGLLSAEYSMLNDSFGRNYNRNDYALCYKCHDENYFVNDNVGNFPFHGTHVNNRNSHQNNTSCSACHDGHSGIDNTHLINFDLSVVQPLNGLIEWQDNGQQAGNCTLVCHGVAHSGVNGYGYPELGQANVFSR